VINILDTILVFLLHFADENSSNAEVMHISECDKKKRIPKFTVFIKENLDDQLLQVRF